MPQTNPASSATTPAATSSIGPTCRRPPDRRRGLSTASPELGFTPATGVAWVGGAGARDAWLGWASVGHPKVGVGDPKVGVGGGGWTVGVDCSVVAGGA